MGTIKPRVDELGTLNALQVNSVFPRLLANAAENLGMKMIHPTTDCVFSGKDGKYTETSPHDVTDIYGRTKSLGEPENCSVIRTSIIGEEVTGKRSLLEWVKSNKNGKICGYTNHFWNGVTCLEFAKVCQSIIDHGVFHNGVRILFSNVLNKFELLNIINDVYCLNIEIEAKETPNKCDRSLYSESPLYIVPSLKEQITEMKEFSPKLYD